MDQAIIVVKNWLNNLHANCKPKSNLKQYFLPKKNHDLIEKITFLKNCSLTMIDFAGCGWGRDLCYNWAKLSMVLGNNFPTSYFALDFVYVGFVTGG